MALPGDTGNPRRVGAEGGGLVKVTRHGWFGFEGFGRPWEAWVFWDGGWRSLGRCFTSSSAERRARRYLADQRRALRPWFPPGGNPRPR